MPPNLPSSSLALATLGLQEAAPWMQLHLTLAPSKAQRQPLPAEPALDVMHERMMVTTRAVNAQVLRCLAPLRRSGALHSAHCQRKEPGLRWRFAASGRAEVEAALLPALENLRKRGRLVDWRETVYEPEHHLFGGHAAMQVVHALFDANTFGWVALDRLQVRKALPYTSGVLALAQGNELFGAALGQRPEEVWDAWCRLATFHDLRPACEPAARARPTLQLLAAHPQAAAARDALHALSSAQQRAGAELAGLALAGQLDQGLRSVLAAVMLFDWNRVGLTPAQRRHVLTQAMGAWHPHVAPVAA